MVMDANELMLVAYWIDGPESGDLVFRTDDPSERVRELAKKEGYDEDDYTVTELFAKAYPMPYEITAQGRAYLEQMKNEQPNSKDAGQATQGRVAPVGGGEVEPRDEDAA